MTPMKLSVFFAFFPYGGNGGTAVEVPQIRKWFAKTLLKAAKDERVGEIFDQDFSDTPIPMTRNAAVEMALAKNFDVVVMCDSDMWPDVELDFGDPEAKPFWEEAFNLLYERKLRGLHTAVGAPYCGPPPHENCYVFHWANWRNDDPDKKFRIEKYSREDAAARVGISGPNEVAALPTGLIMFTTDLFKVAREPWFYYEYDGDSMACKECGVPKPGRQSKKASTEDVAATRDICLFAEMELGYSPVFCAWDSWAGHWKPVVVRKPRPTTVSDINQKYLAATLSKRARDERVIFVGNKNEPRPLAMDLGRLPVREDIPQQTNGPLAGVVDLSKPPADNLNALIPSPAVYPVSDGTPDPFTVIKPMCWAPKPKLLRFARDKARAIKAAKPDALIVELGPKWRPFDEATEFIGWDRPEELTGDDRPFNQTIDLCHDRLPYTDGAVDFLYCRHTLEDLSDPEHLLREIARVAKAGYIEFPSVLAETARRVDAGGELWRGYIHHRWFVWVSQARQLTLLPKYPCIEYAALEDYTQTLAEHLEAWDGSLSWEGELKFMVLRHEKEFVIGKDYERILSTVCARLAEIVTPPSPAQEATTFEVRI